mmetsp:Transcript_117498/g.327268  ORF Transcript_117498/g.327268 Transcript_117498/m.327268 type:complete len:395 (-) Transcript_117498:170-1354(-)
MLLALPPPLMTNGAFSVVFTFWLASICASLRRRQFLVHSRCGLAALCGTHLAVSKGVSRSHATHSQRHRKCAPAMLTIGYPLIPSGRGSLFSRASSIAESGESGGSTSLRRKVLGSFAVLMGFLAAAKSRATAARRALAPMLQLPLGKSGLMLPAIGFGVGTEWFKSQASGRVEELSRSITAALDAGFTHLDEAEVYENEAVTGRVLQEWLARTGKARASLFVTGKVMDCDKGIEQVCRASLKALGCEYFDLFLMHGPFHYKLGPYKRPLSELWQDVEALANMGLAKSIGVSNFRVSDLEQIWGNAKIKPCCNQIERNPYLQQPELLQWCQEHDVLVTAYNPLCPITKLPGGPVDGPINEIAAKHGCTPTQMLLRWSLQTGCGCWNISQCLRSR